MGDFAHCGVMGSHGSMGMGSYGVVGFARCGSCVCSGLVLALVLVGCCWCWWMWGFYCGLPLLLLVVGDGYLAVICSIGSNLAGFGF